MSSGTPSCRRAGRRTQARCWRVLVAQMRRSPLHQLRIHERSPCVIAALSRVRRSARHHAGDHPERRKRYINRSDRDLDPCGGTASQCRNSAAGVALRGPAAASDYYELLPHDASVDPLSTSVRDLANPSRSPRRRVAQRPWHTVRVSAPAEVPEIVSSTLDLSRQRGFITSIRNETGRLLATLAASRTGTLAELGHRLRSRLGLAVERCTQGRPHRQRRARPSSGRGRTKDLRRHAQRRRDRRRLVDP